MSRDIVGDSSQETILKALDTYPELSRLLVPLVKAVTSGNILEPAVLNTIQPTPTHFENAKDRHSKIESILGRIVIVGTITLGDKVFETLLPGEVKRDDPSKSPDFNFSSIYPLATREQNHSYLTDILKKEEHQTINTVGKYVLSIYRTNFVQDAKGGLGVNGCSICSFDERWFLLSRPPFGALHIRDIKEPQVVHR